MEHDHHHHNRHHLHQQKQNTDSSLFDSPPHSLSGDSGSPSSPTMNHNSLSPPPDTGVDSKRILLNTPCKVCCDDSTGKHYGIFACDGCAGFFKRSLRLNRSYICMARGAAANRCLVDNRNQCRACRLNRCLKESVNKNAVQEI